MQEFYASHNFEPLLCDKFLADDALAGSIQTLSGASSHGIDPKIFHIDALKAKLETVTSREKIKNVDDAYQALIELEISAASSLTDYSNAMQFGLVSPRRIFAQYYTPVKRPDSISFRKVFETTDLKNFLDSVQPKAKSYLALQAALNAELKGAQGKDGERARTLMVNLERLRWSNRPEDDKYVWVNIPGFFLQVIEKNRVALQMKVCVGEGRDLSKQTELTEYDENDLNKDRPFNRETPQLKSLIHSVQVNPVWNIPQSIANKEITKYAAADRYYLSNNNIDVYHDGKLVDNPETINWSDGAGGYSFKQRPGDDNSLGKIKFLFDNQSSVYLHDTPAKAAFSKTNRAVSHGCVRVEQPQELAHILFGDGEKFNRIKTGMASKNPKAEDIVLPNKTPVYLDYMTAWLGEDEKIQFVKDVYGLDAVLFTYLNKV
ncbi:L,D-transpeptidase family protein [Pedobacter sp. AW1-32]|uniref:L,D-transpeptidase family protein n=1 Tax=Pedobacter sp. AW1-32 TaxID=3383026 RepID=UPI003FED7835